jgi:hypothetical protein
MMKSNKPTKRSRRRGGKSNKSVPYPEGQISVSNSYHVPPRSYLGTHVGGIAQSIRRTLVWTVAASSATTTGFGELGQVILNSPYDPDASLGGASAAGFAKYMEFYSKCFCLGARIKFTVANCATGFGGASISSAFFGVTVSTGTGAYSSLVNATQAGLCQYKLLNLNPDTCVLDVGVDVAKFVDKPDLLDDPQFFCTSSANPAQLIVAHYWHSQNAVAGSQSVVYFLEVEMDCVFTDPISFT